jgi:ribose/xylose/arabinose/galactoside ABC-type transport system permease subunit
MALGAKAKNGFGQLDNLRKQKFSISQMSSLTMLIISLVAMFIVFTILSPYFMTVSNMINLLQQVSVLGIASAGITLVILSGNLDLSVGSVMAIVAVYTAYIIQLTNNWIIGLIGGFLIGVLCGFINAGMINALKMNPLIVTLGMQSVLRGLARLRNKGVNIPIFDPSFRFIGQGRIFGIPVVVYILIIIYGLMYFVMRYTTFGRKAYAVGGNLMASHYSGINVMFISSAIYILASALAGLAGLCNAAIVGTGAPATGETTPMDAIAAVVLGGASLSGGRASMAGTFVGVVLLGCISNGLTLLGVTSFTQLVVKGAILLLAVFIDVTKNRGKKE